MKRKDADKCVVPGCERNAYSRGRCQKCVAEASARIRANPKYEAYLIGRGLMLPAKRPGRKPKPSK